ncbi:MAG: hypothetical protein M1833_004397 [Piccolia ochrophora]|nr:MAG: hypothetical protein M1833_004397 [Piccolia ochrophora]
MSRGPAICGLYYRGPGQGTIDRKFYLPQVKLQAHSTILSSISRSRLTQTYVNPSREATPEAVYSFPLYDGVSVVGFTCRVGSRLLKGLVKEKAKARAVYDEAVALGQTAGLLEQWEEASDVFTVTVGNVPAGEEAVIDITYLGELKHDAEADGLRYTIPTTVAPRYGDVPYTFLHPNAPVSNREEEMQITVDISMDRACPIRGVQSPSHPIAVTLGTTSVSVNVEMDTSKASATLSLKSTKLDQDFVLLVLAKDIVRPKAMLETHPTYSKHRALMVTLVPKFALTPGRPEIVFIVDQSGSMGDKIPTLKTALRIFLKSLPVGVKFNMCAFGSAYSFLWPKSKTYNQANLKEAQSYLENFSAHMGGTEMLAPIKATLERRYKDLSLEVMLLTDGEIWNQTQLFDYLNQEVHETKAPIRVFTLGIGTAVSHALVEGIARAGNGFSQIVGHEESLDSKVVRMLKGCLSPHIQDYTLEVKYESPVDQDESSELVDRITDEVEIQWSDSDPALLNSTPSKPISLFDEDGNEDHYQTALPADSDGLSRYSYLPKFITPRLLQSPHKIPPLYPFSRTVVYLLLSSRAPQKAVRSVVLRATSDQGPLILEIPVQTLDEPQDMIHQLAVKKAMGELEEGRGWLINAKDEGGVPIRERFEGRWDDMIEREAVRLGVEFQVAGKWCSFVAVESNEEEVAERTRRTIEDMNIDSESPGAQEDNHRRSLNTWEASESSAGSHATNSMTTTLTTDSATDSATDNGIGESIDASSVTSSTFSTGTFISHPSISQGAPQAKPAVPQSELKASFAGQDANTKYLISPQMTAAFPRSSTGLQTMADPATNFSGQARRPLVINHAGGTSARGGYGGGEHVVPQGAPASNAPLMSRARGVPSSGNAQTGPMNLEEPQLGSQSHDITRAMPEINRVLERGERIDLLHSGSTALRRAPVGTTESPSDSAAPPMKKKKESAPGSHSKEKSKKTSSSAFDLPFVDYDFDSFTMDSASVSSTQRELAVLEQQVEDEPEDEPEGSKSPEYSLDDYCVSLPPARRGSSVSPQGEVVAAGAQESRSPKSNELARSSFFDSTESLPPNPASVSPSERMHLLIAIQQFQGDWWLDEYLLSIVDVEPAGANDALAQTDQFPADVREDQGVRASILATALAVRYLEVRFKEWMESWELVVEKARSWLVEKGVSAEGKEAEVWGLVEQLVDREGVKNILMGEQAMEG